MEAATVAGRAAAPARSPRPAPNASPRPPQPGRKPRSRPKPAGKRDRPARRPPLRRPSRAERRRPARARAPARKPRTRPPRPRGAAAPGAPDPDRGRHRRPPCASSRTRRLIVRMTRGRPGSACSAPCSPGSSPSTSSPSASPPRPATSTRTSSRSKRRTRSCAAATRSARAPPASATTPARSGSTMAAVDEVTSIQPSRGDVAVAVQRLAAAGNGLLGRRCASIERRIGLLFAAFLLCFLMIVARAFWLQGVQGAAARLRGRLPADRGGHRARPARHGARPPRRGARRLRGRGDDLRDALPGQEPGRRQPRNSRDPRRGPGGRAREPDRGIRLLLRGQKGRRADRGADRTARAARDRPAPRQPPHLPAGRPGRPGDRRRRHRKRGPDRARGGRGRRARAATDGERHIVKDALGEPIRLETVDEAEDGSDIQLTLDPAIEAKTEQVLAEVGEAYSPKGATAIVMDPRSSQVLAMANWPPVDPADLSERELRRPAQPRDRLHLRAGLDLQGVHRRRRARGKGSDPGDRPSRCRRSSRSPTA